MGKFSQIKESILSESGEDSLSRVQKSLRFMYLLFVHGGKQLVRHRAPQLAAALAYRTIFSLVPVLVLALVVLNATFDKAAIERAFDAIFEYTGLADIQVPASDIESAQDGELVENGDPTGENGDSAENGESTESAAIDESGSDQTDNQDDGSEEYGNQEYGSEENGEQTVALTEYLSGFVERAADTVTNLSFGLITIIGLAVFLYAAISLLIQVEAAFNVVTGARRGRRLTNRLINYWAVLTLGSILIVASLAVGQVYQSRIADLPGFLAAPLSILGRFGATWLLLLLAYMLMPTARVFVKPAAIGALVAAIAWESSKSGLFWFVGAMVGGQAAIYGSLAILPVALLWIYVTWFIVLFGLELAYSYQTVREVDLRRSLRGKIFDDEPMVDAFSPVLLMAEAARGFADGKSVSLSTVRDQVAEPDSVLSRLIKVLQDAHYLHAVETEEEDTTRYSLARSPKDITVADVLSACDGLFEPSASQRQGHRGKSLVRRLRSMREDTFSALTLEQLIAETPDPSSNPESVSSDTNNED